MGRFEGLIGKFILSALLFLGLFSFIIIIQSDNEAVDPIINNSVFNESFQGLIISIDNSTEESQEKYNVFNSEEPETGIGSILLFAIVSVGKSFSTIIFGFFTAIIKLPLIVLGISESIYSLILTWLIILAIVSVWLLYKLGG